MDFANKSGLITTGNIGPLFQATGQDINHTGDGIWSGVGFNLGLSLGGSKSEGISLDSLNQLRSKL